MADEESWVPISELPFSKRTAQRLAKAKLLRVELRDLATKVARQQDGLRKAEWRACALQKQIDEILATLRSRE